MTSRRLTVTIDQFETAGTFSIAGYSHDAAEVVTVRIEEDGVTGRGEACGVYYHDETPGWMRDAIERVRGDVEAGATRQDLLTILPAGGPRNAIDCALWDLEAKRSGVSVGARLGDDMHPRRVNFTIGINNPAVMAQKARDAAAYPRLKVKLDGDGDIERVAAVRAARPDADIMVDANMSWAAIDLERHIAELARFGVLLVEQPVPPGQDALLDGVKSPIPLCADESIQDVATLDAVAERYSYINIKLDKAGGLTAALILEKAAIERGLLLMTGCMLGTSLGIAPAYFASRHSRYNDLDSPLLLARDRDMPVRYVDGHILAPDPALWG
jgi:L-alanine-DL-glutamate epimerase-like enolase superfamily enzyme